MDAILSIPFFSFLLIPAFSSYSTSLNILFFYLTWSTLILSNSPLKVEIVGTLAVRLLFYVLPSLGFLLFDNLLPNIAAGIKEHGNSALPLSEGIMRRRSRWWKVLLMSMGNVLLAIALQLGIELLFTEVFHIRSALKVTTSLPMPWEIAKDLFSGILMREGFTYALHRYALHSPSSPLHYQHMLWQHSASPPYSLAAHYDHPLPYLVHIFLPTYIPAILSRFHLLTYYMYLAIISLEETFAYSGYNVLPSGFLLGAIARRQERHLIGGGEGNYGSLGLVDLVLGTSLGDDILAEIEEEVDKTNRTKTKSKGARRRPKRHAKSTEEDS